MSYHTLMRFPNSAFAQRNSAQNTYRWIPTCFREVLENGTSIRILVPADKQQIDEKMNGLIGITDD